MCYNIIKMKKEDNIKQEAGQMIKGETVMLDGCQYILHDFRAMGDGWYDAILTKPHLPGIKFYGIVRERKNN